jgi:hypothetical protein
MQVQYRNNDNGAFNMFFFIELKMFFIFICSGKKISTIIVPAGLPFDNILARSKVFKSVKRSIGVLDLQLFL